MTISPGESQFSKIHLCMAPAFDVNGALQFRSGDFLETRDGDMRTTSGSFRKHGRHFRTDEGDIAIDDTIHDGLAKKANWGVAVLEIFKRLHGGFDFSQ